MSFSENFKIIEGNSRLGVSVKIFKELYQFYNHIHLKNLNHYYHYQHVLCVNMKMVPEKGVL